MTLKATNENPMDSQTIRRKAMRVRAGWAALVLLGCGVGGGAGCLLRTEKISVAPDGQVTISIEYKGALEDFDTTDALPSADSGWPTFMTKNPDEENEHTLTATRTFEAGAALPSRYAAPDDPQADLYLQFPTSVEKEERPDGTYYTFRRFYPLRQWAYTHYWEARFLESQNMQELGKKNENDLTDAERFEVILAFARAEAYKQTALIQEATHAAGISIVDANYLTARSALLAAYGDDAVRSIMVACANTEGDARDACMASQADKKQASALQSFQDTLATGAKVSRADLTRFAAAYERAKTRQAVTEEVGGHHFDIMVQLPGTIVAHNASEVEQAGDGSKQAFRWEFTGEAVRDRVHLLTAITKVAHKAKALDDGDRN